MYSICMYNHYTSACVCGMSVCMIFVSTVYMYVLIFMSDWHAKVFFFDIVLHYSPSLFLTLLCLSFFPFLTFLPFFFLSFFLPFFLPFPFLYRLFFFFSFSNSKLLGLSLTLLLEHPITPNTSSMLVRT